MTPTDFPLTNAVFGPPVGLEESQVHSVRAYIGEIPGPHPMEGSTVCVVAWKPSPEEIATLLAGGLIYLSVIGGLPPHFLTTKIEEATYANPVL